MFIFQNYEDKSNKNLSIIALHNKNVTFHEDI